MRSVVARALTVAAVAAAANAVHAQQSASPIGGAWVGTYTCSQGLTGLTLTLQAQDSGDIAGYFHFYPPVANANAKEGCFSVRGRVDAGGAIAIEAVRWMTQPEGYVTVDLAGRIDAMSLTMTGTVIAQRGFSAACTVFEIKRQASAPRISPLCHAGTAQAATPNIR